MLQCSMALAVIYGLAIVSSFSFYGKVNLRSPDLPYFFGAEASELTDSCRKAIVLLDQEGQASYMVVRDEVVFSKTWSLIYGMLPDPSKGAVVGGQYPHHLLPREDDRTATAMDPGQLAEITVCTVLKRMDRRSGCVMVQMMPRSHKVTAKEEFHAMGCLLQSCHLL